MHGLRKSAATSDNKVCCTHGSYILIKMSTLTYYKEGQNHIQHITIELHSLKKIGNHLGGDYVSFFPEDFGVLAGFLNCAESRALAGCVDSAFLLIALVDFPFVPCS